MTVPPSAFGQAPLLPLARTARTFNWCLVMPHMGYSAGKGTSIGEVPVKAEGSYVPEFFALSLSPHPLDPRVKYPWAYG